jgi:hypothetical protein
MFGLRGGCPGSLRLPVVRVAIVLDPKWAQRGPASRGNLMADHLPDCEKGELDCAGWGCGVCEQCLFDFENPRALTFWKDPAREPRRLCQLCMGVIPADPVQTVLYVGNAILAEIRSTR